MNKANSKQIAINIGMALALILVLVFGVNRFLAFYTHHDEKIPVPNLYGLQVPEAENLLDELGLRYEIRDSLFEEGKPRNAVLQQDPDTGEFVKEGRIIYLSINANDVPRIKMPDLKAKNIHQAIMILESMGLKVGRIDTVRDIAEDAVQEQRYQGKIIRPNTEIGQGSVIDLVISDGADQQGFGTGDVGLPDLEGSTLDDARIILEASGLRLGQVNSRGMVRDSSEATIVEQNPSYSPEIMLRRGSFVSVTIKQ